MPQLLVTSALAADTARTIVAQNISLPAALTLMGMVTLGAVAFLFRNPLPPHRYHKSNQGHYND